MLDIWLRYDLRSPPFGLSSVDLASAAIEQVEWADKRGFHTVQLTEHHCTLDNVNPSPLIFGAALASRTSNIRIQPSAIILPLHDPVRIAEDSIMVDIISNGRLDLTLGLGYMAEEFAMFGVSLADRARLMDRKLEVLRRIFDGEQFEYEGRIIHVTPSPVQKGGPNLYIGGNVAATARRAAKYGDGYYPMSPKPELIDEYRNACAALGKTPGRVFDGNGATVVHIAEDPDAAWAKIAPYAMHESNVYATKGGQAAESVGYSTTSSAAALRATGGYRVLTPEQGLAYFRQERDLGHYLALNPLVSGIDPKVSWESLELIAGRIIPELQKDELAKTA